MDGCSWDTGSGTMVSDQAKPMIVTGKDGMAFGKALDPSAGSSGQSQSTADSAPLSTEQRSVGIRESSSTTDSGTVLEVDDERMEVGDEQIELEE